MSKGGYCSGEKADKSISLNEKDGFSMEYCKFGTGERVLVVLPEGSEYREF